jgi:hypothetical protein
MRQRLASSMSCVAPAPEIRISDDVRMTGNGSGRLLPAARSVDVPLTADRVAPPRLVYGGLDLAPDASRDDGYAAIYFTVAGDGQLGRVTFEGIDAVRAARGETLPYDINPPRTRDDWVFTVDDSPWLAERHNYEMQRYSTPLAETHQHYVFQFHDEFAEAIAEGIWLDIADPARPYARPARHPLAELDPGLPRDRFRSASGIEWELRHAPGSDAELISGSRLCSQRLYQLNLILDGRSREGASIWLRTRNGRTVSRFARPWPGGELARHEGVARPEDFEDPWEAYLASVAQRRREMGR